MLMTGLLDHLTQGGPSAALEVKEEADVAGFEGDDDGCGRVLDPRLLCHLQPLERGLTALAEAAQPADGQEELFDERGASSIFVRLKNS